MKKWMAAAALLAFATASFAAAPYRQDGRAGRMREFQASHGHFMNQRLLALLDNDQFKSKTNITDNQASRLRKIIIDTQESSIKTRAEMQVEEIELHELLRQDKSDQDAVMKKVQRLAELRGDMMQDNIKALLGTKEVLSPEQQKQVREFLRGGFSRGGWGGQHRMGPHGPGMGPADQE